MITHRQGIISTTLTIAAILIAIAFITRVWLPHSAATHEPDPIAVNLDDMAHFELDVYNGTINDIPQRFRDLDGKRLTFKCDMWSPHTRPDGTLSSFQAISSNHRSDHGPPLPQEFWACNLPAGITVRYFENPVNIIGRLHINIQRENEMVHSVYEVDVQSVEPSQRGTFCQGFISNFQHANRSFALIVKTNSVHYHLAT